MRRLVAARIFAATLGSSASSADIRRTTQQVCRKDAGGDWGDGAGSQVLRIRPRTLATTTDAHSSMVPCVVSIRISWFAGAS